MATLHTQCQRKPGKPGDRPPNHVLFRHAESLELLSRVLVTLIVNITALDSCRSPMTISTYLRAQQQSGQCGGRPAEQTSENALKLPSSGIEPVLGAHIHTHTYQ
jgi:hypothetical protein